MKVFCLACFQVFIAKGTIHQVTRRRKKTRQDCTSLCQLRGLWTPVYLGYLWLGFGNVPHLQTSKHGWELRSLSVLTLTNVNEERSETQWCWKVFWCPNTEQCKTCFSTSSCFICMRGCGYSKTGHFYWHFQLSFTSISHKFQAEYSFTTQNSQVHQWSQTILGWRQQAAKVMTAPPPGSTDGASRCTSRCYGWWEMWSHCDDCWDLGAPRPAPSVLHRAEKLI